jgi:hypothetical protein
MNSFNIYHLVILVGLAFPPVLGWRFAKKLGYHGAWGLLAWTLCIPWAGILVLALLAFTRLPTRAPVGRDSASAAVQHTTL